MAALSLRSLSFTAVTLVGGAVAGVVFSRLGTPLPYMLGSLVFSAFMAVFLGDRFPAGYTFPVPMRHLFVGVIGVMIGAQVTPEIVALLPKMAVSVPAVLVFVALAHYGNFKIFRKVGKLDSKTAFYAGTPGGLLESLAFGEEDGADLRMLTILQFLRIIVVVVVLPFAISIYEGGPVGSAAGLSSGLRASGLTDLALTLVFAVVGLWLGMLTRVPAAQLTGPLIIVGAASGFGLVDLTIAPWLVALAQVVLGATLGLRFVGLTRRMLVEGLGLAVLSSLFMMALGAVFAVVIARVAGLDIETMIISFAPGGVTEMSLIALSLAANPAFVTLHHLVRIIAAVVDLALVRKLGWLRD